MKNKRFTSLFISIPLLVLAGGISLFANASEGFSRFIRPIGLWFSTAAGRFSGLFPFPLSEVLIVAAVIFIPFWCIRLIVKGKWPGAFKALKFLLLMAGIVMFIFTINWGVQYTAPPISEYFNITINNGYPAADLAELTEFLLDNANFWAENVLRDIDGNIAPYDYKAMAEDVITAYHGMNAAVFDVNNAVLPKQSLILSEVMPMVSISGYYFPFTGESIVSRTYVYSHLPYTTAHEAAHSMGVGSESEANFAAFLACMYSDDPLLQYSGYLCAYVYAANSLAKADPAMQQEIRGKMSPTVRRDVDILNAHHAKYADMFTSNVGSTINNNYIKATGQSDGIKAYSMVVELILDYYVKYVR